MNKVDISSEAVERFTPHLYEDWRGMMGVTAGMRSTANGKYVRYEAYEAQAERIKTLESAAMDRLVAEGQRCDAIAKAILDEMCNGNLAWDQLQPDRRDAYRYMARAAIAALTVTPQEAAKVLLAECRRVFFARLDAWKGGDEHLIKLDREALRAISEDSHE